MEKDKFDLFKLVQNEFQIAHDSLSEQSEFRSFENWSSLNALIFISAITEHTGIFISSTELAQWHTLGDIQAFIDSQHNG